MNYLKKFLLIFFIFLISTNLSNSKETAFVDIDYIVANSNIGKKVLENISKLDKKNIENLKKKINLYKNLKLLSKIKKM